MKKFLKKIDWKKFLKYELICFGVVGALYFNSVFQGNNVFPENLYVIFLIPGIFAFMMLLKTHTVLMETKFTRKAEELKKLEDL